MANQFSGRLSWVFKRCGAAGMRATLTLVLIFGLWFASFGKAFAGPWPRAPGKWFLSFSEERDSDANYYTQFYLEYGLTPRVTLGAELGKTRSEKSLLVWLQWANMPEGRPDRWSASLGLGMVDREEQLQPLGQATIAWGRGWDNLPLLDRIRGGGWLTAELKGQLSTEPEEYSSEYSGGETYGIYLTPSASGKLDLTIGWNANERLKLMSQLRFEHRDEGLSTRLVVSGVHDLVGPLKLELGAITPLDSKSEAAIKLGLWLDL